MLISFADIKIRLFTIFSLNDIPMIFFTCTSHLPEQYSQNHSSLTSILSEPQVIERSNS